LPGLTESKCLLTLIFMVTPRSNRKAQIIQAALAVAADVGASRITAQAIADRVGIAQPTVFRHFKSVDAIFEAALDTVAEEMALNLAAVLSDQAPADQRLKTLIQRQLQFVAARRGMPRLLFSERLQLENPVLRERVLNVMRGFGERVAGLIEEGAASGRFRSDLDAAQTARLVIALIQGLVLRWSLSGFTFPLDDPKQAEAVWNLLWPALAAGTPKQTGKTRRKT
jgi:TetR/AcrR family transcriptional regulator